MIDYEKTLISQYANSPRLRQLLEDWSYDIDPRRDFNFFYSTVWNVNTALSWGLDVWARIVDVGRWVKRLPKGSEVFGFRGTGCQPFNQAPFYEQYFSSRMYGLGDSVLRKLIMVKARANISNCSAQSMNQALTKLFGDHGRCYSQSLGKMRILYVFEFFLTDLEMAILTQTDAMLNPAGVGAQFIQLDPPTTFGFNGSNLQPFGQGVFSKGVTNVG